MFVDFGFLWELIDPLYSEGEDLSLAHLIGHCCFDSIKEMG